MSRFRLSRRTVLRGVGLAGVSVALPVLEVMHDGRGLWFTSAEAAAVTPPLRFVLFHISNGVSATSLAPWTPSGAGAGYTLSPALQPLGALSNKINVITGLKHTAYYLSQGTGEHAKATASLLAGVGTTTDSAQATTIDQLIAGAWANQTALASVQAICDPSGPPVAGKDDLPPIRDSWRAPGQPMPPIEDPASYFKRLFGSSPASNPNPTPMPGSMPDGAAREARYRKSVLDYVASDIGSLNKVLGAEDKQRLGLHLQVIRDLENQIAFMNPAAPGGGGGTTTPGAACQQAPTQQELGGAGSGEARVKMMTKLTALALQCDLTRVATLQYGWPFGNATFPWIGVSGGDHDLSHGSNDGYLPCVKYKVQTFASLVQMLHDTADGARTLLENSLVMATSDVGLGSHNTAEHGVLLAGTAGGQIKTGMHQVFAQGTPLNQLMLSVLQLLKIPGITKFGADGNQPLALA